MLYREFGKTGFQASAIGLGTWNIGNQWGTIDETTAIDTIRSAVDYGVNLIDTADSYGIPNGLSEERVGKALAGLRDKVHIVTKIGRWGRLSGERVSMATVDMVRLCAHASLFRLCSDYVDVLLCHEGLMKERITDPAQMNIYLEGFEILKEKGYVRFYGISTGELELLKRFNVNGTCSVVEVDYSLLRRDPEAEFFPYCQEHGIAVIARGPLHKGLLSGKYSSEMVFTDTIRSQWHESDRAQGKLSRKLSKVENLKAVLSPGEEMVAAALGFVISHPVQPVALTGAKSPEQAAMNAKAGENLLSPEDRNHLVQCSKGKQTDKVLA